MGIFRRRDKNQGDPEVTTAPSANADDAVDDAVEADVEADVEAGGETDAQPSVETEVESTDELQVELDAAGDEEPLNRARGPFDASELPDDGDDEVVRLDLGALQLVPVEGMQLRLEVDEAQQTVLSVHAVLGDSSVQLQAFAAPRTLPVWPEIRAEIADNVTAGGGTADVVRGELGRELLCRMPQQGPDGRTVFAQVRFAGVDGPRWFLRAVFSGPAAIDDAAAAPLVEMVRNTVVVRGDGAMPPREVLPLTLPQEAQQEGAAAEPDAVQGEAEGAGATGGTVHVDDLKPFERGPEITEVR